MTQNTPAPADLVEAVEHAVMRSQGLDPTEVCGLEIEDGDDCTSGTCCAAHFEDHDPAHARAVYRKIAKTAIAAHNAHMASDGVVQVDIDLAALCVPGALIFADAAEHIADARRRAAEHIAKFRRTAAGKDWVCAALVNVGAGDPQDCGWPMCGCDPHAEKVIEALGESGIATPQPDPRDAEIQRLGKALRRIQSLADRCNDLPDTDGLRRAYRDIDVMARTALANSEGKAND